MQEEKCREMGDIFLVVAMILLTLGYLSALFTNNVWYTSLMIFGLVFVIIACYCLKKSDIGVETVHDK